LWGAPKIKNSYTAMVQTPIMTLPVDPNTTIPNVKILLYIHLNGPQLDFGIKIRQD
jgi:hypothetical protein